MAGLLLPGARGSLELVAAHKDTPGKGADGRFRTVPDW
jgi:hypothetical protein